MISSVIGNTRQFRRVVLRQPYLFALVLLVLVVIINASLQRNFFRPAILTGNLQAFLPLMLLAAGQAIVIIGGGVDLSVGAIVSLANVVFVRMLGNNPTPSQVVLAIALGLASGLLAGLFNGICVAYLRFQPIITTFASSFVFSGVALWVLPQTQGIAIPGLTAAFTSSPLGIPTALWIVVVVLIAWNGLRSTRYGRYLYAVGGQDMSAYITGVPVARVRLSTYMLSGLMAACAAFVLTLSTATGAPAIGEQMTLSAIVAVVLGGTRLRGGQGGVTGALLGVIILRIILNIISFARVPSLWQTLVSGLIVMLILVGPGIIALVRRGWFALFESRVHR